MLARVNCSEYGLASYVFTRILDRALRVCEWLEVGMVGLNRGVLSNAAAPFGGVKASGFGREGAARASRSTSRPSASRSTSPSSIEVATTGYD